MYGTFFSYGKVLGEMQLEFSNEAFCLVPANEETIVFYDSWSDKSYQEELDEQQEDTKEMLASQMKDVFGIDIDFSDLEDKINEKKKDKKQIEQETRQEQQLKSIRSIYISLAKLLHPDTEIDPEEKLHKEELMKRVISAYEEKDLSTLLKFEMEWVAKE